MANNSAKNGNNKAFTVENLYTEVIATLKAKGVKQADLPTEARFKQKSETSTSIGSLPIDTTIELTGEITIEVTGNNEWYAAKTTTGNIISLKNLLPLRLGDVKFEGEYRDVSWATKNTPTDKQGNNLAETPIIRTLNATTSSNWESSSYQAITDIAGNTLGEINPMQLYIAVRNGKYNLTGVKLTLKAYGVRTSTARKAYEFGGAFIRIGDPRATSIPVWQNA